MGSLLCHGDLQSRGLTMSDEPVKEVNVNIKSVPVVEPAPLGITGLAIATLLIGLKYSEIAPHDAVMIIPWIVFVGGATQLIAGIMEFKRDNIFGVTVFTTYALFLFTVGSTLMIAYFSDIPPEKMNMEYYGYGVLGILIFSLICSVASLAVNKVFVFIFIVLDLAMVFIILHYVAGYDGFVQHAAGYLLLAASALSFYAVAAILLNTITKKKLLSMGAPFWVPK